VEVDQEADGLSGEAKIGQNLGLVNGHEAFHGFAFDNDRVVDQQIDAETGVDP
jgi:hypothetical protein